MSGPNTASPPPSALFLAAQGIADPKAQAAVEAGFQVLAAFLRAFNARDARLWSSTLNYPHVRLAGGEVQVWQTAADYAAGNDLERFVGTGWHHTKWDWINPVQASADKVHFALQFTRFDSDDKPINSFQATYIVTRQNDHWGIQARSSYAGIAWSGAAF
jgi:hypothetical protein